MQSAWDRSQDGIIGQGPEAWNHSGSLFFSWAIGSAVPMAISQSPPRIFSPGPGVAIRFSPRRMPTTVTPNVWRMRESASVWPAKGESPLTRTSAISKRLLGSAGCFRGVEIPEDLTDDPGYYLGLPYVDLLYRYLSGSYSRSAA